MNRKERITEAAQFIEASADVVQDLYKITDEDLAMGMLMAAVKRVEITQGKAKARSFILNFADIFMK